MRTQIKREVETLAQSLKNGSLTDYEYEEGIKEIMYEMSFLYFGEGYTEEGDRQYAIKMVQLRLDQLMDGSGDIRDIFSIEQ